MPLTKDQFQVVKDWLSTHPMTTKCPLCLDPPRWETRELVALPVKSDDAYTLDERGLTIESIAMVQLVCASCGYMAHFSATKIGLP